LIDDWDKSQSGECGCPARNAIVFDIGEAARKLIPRALSPFSITIFQLPHTLPYWFRNAKSDKEFRVKRHDPPKIRRSSTDNTTEVAGLRIVGGKFRGRKLNYSGDLRTRPMKDRLREAIFNLIGTDIRGTHAFDLFAGTGALGLEALSRGAARATFLEQHFPTAAIIKQNIAVLEVVESTEVVPGNTFIWFERQKKDGRFPLPGENPWAVFCSPPYDFFVDRTAEMLELIGEMLVLAPEKSVFIVEADNRFDFQLLPQSEAWDVRAYSPAVVGIHRKNIRNA
jgi:16S rRNA (guanine(966)-N(2))-methyltransferase RsmD